MPDQHPRDYYNRRFGELDTERESFVPHWKELSEFIRPRRGRFFLSDRNKGTKKYSSIINSKATQDHRIATSGMLAGTMNPTEPWFNFETADLDLMERAEVKDWLHKVEILLRAILNESNFYSMVSTYLGELLLFGTAAMTHLEDFNDVARFYTHTAGSYYIAQNERFEVDTLYREFEWTAEQIVRAFGKDNISQSIQTALDNSNYGAWFPVRHVLEPNDDFRPSSPLARNKPFKSVYYEPGAEGVDRDKWLNISGFDEFPAHVSRWETTGEDIYGNDSPAMQALGDIKGLQVEEKRKAQAIDKMVNPPLKGPPSIRNSPISTLPGGLNIAEGSVGSTELGPLYTVTPQLGDLRDDISAVERRIDSAFYVDLFLAISNIEGIQPRNELDLLQRNQERLLQLGPPLQRLQGDFQDNLLDRLFNQALRANILPPIPQSLSGAPLRIKYVSTLAMAQKAAVTQNIDRVVAFAGGLMELGFEGAQRKIDPEQAVDEYSKAVGIPPSIIVSDEIVAEQKQKEQEQQEALLALEQGQQAANITKMASDAKTGDDSVLTAITG